MKIQPIIRQSLLVLFSLWLALSLRAQGVFQATLNIPFENGGGGGLVLGDFWCQVAGNELQFITQVDTSTFTSSLNPVLSVPGSSVEFSLGAALQGFTGSQTDPDWNPFLPPQPLVPAGYDCDGNPYYVTPGPIIQIGSYYSGQFELPPGFLDELLAGEGTVQLNSSIGGNISVAVAPEPSTFALAAMAGCGWLLVMRWRIFSGQFYGGPRKTGS
jgi:hypothetical protein